MNKIFTQETDQLVHMLVHEMRNPLTNISLANECINEMANGNHFDGVNMKAFTELIAKNVNKVEQVMRKLLHANRQESTDFAETDLCNCIEEALLRAEDRIYLQEVEVIKCYQARPAIQADGEKLTVAFLNIINNALEAMENRAAPQLNIMLCNDDGGIKIVFKDNGKGMDDVVAEKIFHSQYTTKTHGMGVGLSHTKKILDMHGASILINSLAGIGTSVVVSFL